jgi:hypothetical protein
VKHIVGYVARTMNWVYGLAGKMKMKLI